MADIIDDAQKYNELYDEVAFKNHALKVAPEQHPDFDGTHCVDCEVEIQPQRLLLGRVRCIDCQEYLARVEKMRLINGRPSEDRA